MLFWHFFRQLILSRRAGSLIRRIAFLSIAAIGLSVFAFLVVLFVMNGMNGSIRDRLLALEPHLVLTAETLKSAEEVATDPASRAAARDPSAKIAFFESQDVIVRTLSGQFRGVVAKGIDEEGLQDFMNEVRRLMTKAGVSASDLPPMEVPGEGEVIVGIDLARSLDLFEGDPLVALAPESLLLPSGETPRIERLRVKRVLATNLSDLDSQLFYYVRGKALRGLARSPARRAGFEVRIPDGNQAAAWREALGETPGFRRETWAERNSALFFALKMERLMIGTFLGLAGLVAGASILTVMALLLSHKRRDIALLRVVGLSSANSVSLFTRMGLTLAGIAVIGGMVAGVAAGLWIEAHPLNVLPGEVYYDSSIPARFDAGLVVWTLLVAAALAFLGAWIPSRSAADIQPSQVLRQKN